MRLRRLCIILVAALSLALPIFAVERVERGTLVMEGIPEIPERVAQRVNQYLSTRSAFFVDWLPQGMLVATRFADTYQLHAVAQPMGMRRQLTFFKEPAIGHAYSRSLGGFTFFRDIGGNENYQIFFFNMADGTSRLLTDGKSRNTDARWSNCGAWLAFASNKRDGKNSDVYILDVAAGGEPRMLFQADGTYSPEDWSPDDKKLIISKTVSINESYRFILDLETLKLTPVDPSPEKVSIRRAAFSRDGSGIYVRSDKGSEFVRLRYVGFDGTERVVSGDIPWDVEGFRLSKDGRWLAYIVNEAGISRLHLYDIRQQKEVRGPDIPVGVVDDLLFDPSSKRLALSINSATSSNDVFVYDLGTRKLTRWTESEAGGLDPKSFVEPQLFAYPTFDTVDGKPRQISAFVYRPAGKGPHPVLLYIHGGPEAQYRPDFSSMFQYYLNELGFAVIAPNVRGSAGYGKQFLLLDNAMKREDSVKDVGALLDWIVGQPDLDASRVVVMGGSYGGYMTLASLVHYGDRLAGGIESVGISDFVTFLEGTEDYRRDLRRAEYGDERDPEMRAFLKAISPMTHAGKIKKPLLVAQGANDPRVPLKESEQMVKRIRENGGEVLYFMARDEGHGFQKRANLDRYYEAVVAFLERLQADRR